MRRSSQSPILIFRASRSFSTCFDSSQRKNSLPLHLRGRSVSWHVCRWPVGCLQVLSVPTHSLLRTITATLTATANPLTRAKPSQASITRRVCKLLRNYVKLYRKGQQWHSSHCVGS